MNNFTIDIVIPTLNSAKTIEWTLLALSKIIEKGSSPNILVVDSGSTDETLQHVGKYGFKIVYYPKGNMYAAINHGLRMGNSPWCTYINSDDILYPDTFISLLSFAQKTNADLIYGNIDYIDEDGHFLHSWNSPSPSMLSVLFKSKSKIGLPQPGTIFSRNIYEQLYGFNEKFKYVGDYDFFFRAYQSGARFYKYNLGTIAAFRLHSSQISQTKVSEMRNEKEMIYLNADKSSFSLQRFYAPFIVKTKNLSNYLIRILRWRQLNRTFIFPRTTTIINEKQKK